MIIPGGCPNPLYFLNYKLSKIQFRSTYILSGYKDKFHGYPKRSAHPLFFSCTCVSYQKEQYKSLPLNHIDQC